MHRSHRRFTRTLTIGTAAAFGLSGLFIAPAAFAAAPDAVAPTSGAEYTAQSKLLLTDDTVQAVGRDANGNVVVVKIAGESSELSAFSDSYSNVVVKEIGGPLESTAATDVVGGAGYFSPTGPTSVASCSVGFSAWSPTGAPAVITAGHCADDGANTETFLSVPALDAAGEGVAPLAPLGDFGFSQYGGPGNSAGAEDATSTDIAVIDVTNANLDLVPAVSPWTDLTDLSTGAIPITSVGKITPGIPVSKSGRTTGFSTSSDIDIVDGLARVGDRIVYGFGVNNLEATFGDSGGAVFQGNTAVGLVSGVSTDTTGPAYMWGTDLQNGLQYTGGYTVALALTAPTLTAPLDGGDVERGTPVNGTGPASSTITITPETGAAWTVPTDANGAFSFIAPNALGEYAFTLSAKKGFDVSPTTSVSVNVVPAPLQAPAITSPEGGSSSTSPVTAIKGTAVPGATVTLTGDVTGTTVANAAGDWSVDADLSYGLDYTVTATQALEGQVSPSATIAFNVVPTAAVITTPADGATFANSEAPTSATGTGITGATITLIQNGGEAKTTTVVDGRWSIALSASQVGGNTLLVTQSIDGIATVTQSGYTLAAPAVAVAPPAPTTPNVEDPRLANTGTDLLPMGGLAAALLLAGAAFLALRKIRIGSVKN